MHHPWIYPTTTLLEVFEAVQRNEMVERSCIDLRTGSFRPGWPSILTKLTVVEIAMLQDLSWWGHHMEHRLTQLTDVRRTS